MFEYNPDHVVTNWGTTLFTGFGADSKVTGARHADATKLHVGADGQATVTVNPDKTGMITVVLVQGSPANGELIAALKQQESTGRLVKRPFSVVDLAGSVVVTAPNAWLRKHADHEFAAEAKERTWIFDCDKLEYDEGKTLF